MTRPNDSGTGYGAQVVRCIVLTSADEALDMESGFCVCLSACLNGVLVFLIAGRH